MRFAIGRCAAQCGLSALLAMVLSPAVLAEAAIQRQELAAALRQLDRLERLIRHSEANTPVIAGDIRACWPIWRRYVSAFKRISRRHAPSRVI